MSKDLFNPASTGRITLQIASAAVNCSAIAVVPRLQPPEATPKAFVLAEG